MYNLRLSDRRHDCGTDRHILDTKSVAVRCILLAHLWVVVEVLLLLHRRFARLVDDVDSRQPFDRARTDVAEDDDAERETVDSGQRLAVHLPGQHDLVELDFSPGDGHDVVVDFVFLEVGVCAGEFNVRASVFQTATVL